MVAGSVSGSDFGWIPFAASTVIVSSVAGAASFFPAWRATLLSPMVAMREQSTSIWQWAHRRMARSSRDRSSGLGRTTADRKCRRQSADGVRRGRPPRRFVRRRSSADARERVRRARDVESATLLDEERRFDDRYRSLSRRSARNGRTSCRGKRFLDQTVKRVSVSAANCHERLKAIAEWAEEYRPERLDEIRTLAAAGVRMAVPLQTRNEMLGVLLLGAGSPRAGSARRGRCCALRRSVRADD